MTLARALLPEVEVPMDIRLKISQVCAELDVDGLRGDLVTTRASRAAAAFRFVHYNVLVRNYLSHQLGVLRSSLMRMSTLLSPYAYATVSARTPWQPLMRVLAFTKSFHPSSAMRWNRLA